MDEKANPNDSKRKNRFIVKREVINFRTLEEAREIRHKRKAEIDAHREKLLREASEQSSETGKTSDSDDKTGK